MNTGTHLLETVSENTKKKPVIHTTYYYMLYIDKKGVPFKNKNLPNKKPTPKDFSHLLNSKAAVGYMKILFIFIFVYQNGV